MLKQDTLHTDSKERLINGIRKCASAVGVTMGTGGSNSLIECLEHPGFFTTNDGVTILENIKLSDPIEEIGRKILLEAVKRANKLSGDGSSTTCVLTAAIIEEGIKHLDKASAMDIKRSLEACIPLIEESINQQKRDITVDEVGKVASISAEDEQIGATIQEIYQKIGKDGIIYWDVSKTATDSYTIGSGLTIEGASVGSPYMCDVDPKSGYYYNIATLKDTPVLVTKEKLSNAELLSKVIQSLNEQGKKSLAIFCNDFEVNIVPVLQNVYSKIGFRVVVIKMPTIWGDQWFEDTAKASGATLIDPVGGLKMRNMTLNHLGVFGHVVVTNETCHIDGIQDLTEYIASLQAQNEDDSTLRASRLNTKTARYYVGAHSESALAYRRLKVEDAINAGYQALQGGVVAGGGLALRNAATHIKGDSVGSLILAQALLAPIKQIGKNAGISDSLSITKPTDTVEEFAVDTRTKKVVNMFEAGITDPAIVTLNAVKQAISVAASVLTTNTLVTLPSE